MQNIIFEIWLTLLAFFSGVAVTIGISIIMNSSARNISVESLLKLESDEEILREYERSWKE